jgi:hypothetical protein
MNKKNICFLLYLIIYSGFGSFSQTIIWTNDFSSTNDWSVINNPNGLPPHTNGGWVFDSSPSLNLTHTYGLWQEVDFYAPSSSNGFIKINTACNGGTQNSSISCNTSINLSAYTNVYLDFQEFYSGQSQSSFIIYSIDGGISWSELLFSNHDFGFNQVSSSITTNPSNAYCDLSNQIGGQANVKIGFKLAGDCSAAWIVDDVKLVSTPNVDLIANESYLYGNLNPGGVFGVGTTEMRYSKIPKSQLNSYSVKTKLTLIGSQSQNNISINANLNGNYNSNLNNIQLDPFVRDTFVFNNQLILPNIIGSYAVQISSIANLDVNQTNNNVVSSPIEVTNDLYAFDDGVCRRLQIYNNNLAFETGNTFEFFQPSTLKNIQFFIDSSSTLGLSYYVKLYQYNIINGSFDSIGRSPNFILTQNQLNSFVSVPLNLPLNANTNYIATVGSIGNNLPGSGLKIGYSNMYSYQCSFFHDYGAQGQGAWYYNQSNAMVRMEIADCQFPNTPNICITGIDSATNKNRIIWEKPLLFGIDSFFVYKETNQANVYSKIGATDFLDSAIFVDFNSSPTAQSSRYKISIFDSCGTESPLSEPHKTIHLTINQGVGNSYNLIWSHYEGIPFSSYNIYRGTSINNLSLLTTIQSNLNSFTDLNPPLGNVYYQIEIVSPIICDPTKSLDFGSSRSNLIDNNFSQLITLANCKHSIYPNPATNLLIVESSAFEDEEYYIFDQIGKLILKGKLNGQNTLISLDSLQNGFYNIQFQKGEIAKFILIKN